MHDELLEKLLNSKKYRDICPDTVRRIWDECCGKYKKAKDVDKAVREQLHGITDAFLSVQDAAQCVKDLVLWAEGGRTDELLEKALSCHASTRERLPLKRTDAMYERIFAVTGRPGTVLDLACGINPIYLGARGIRCVGADISGQAVEAINTAAKLCSLPVSAVCSDLLNGDTLPRERFDVALLFKILPLLERQRSGSALALMQRIDAEFLVISFPTKSLSGRNVGMEDNYSQWMENHLPEDRTVAVRSSEENELYYVLKAR